MTRGRASAWRQFIERCVQGDGRHLTELDKL